MNNQPTLLNETAIWRGRDVRYWAGHWDSLRQKIPQFEIAEFRAGDNGPSNPHMKSIMRLSQAGGKDIIPVGVVSNAYRLAQHSEVADKCFEGIRASGIETDDLTCELGLTELGEWMNLRIFFPDTYCHHPSDGKKLSLRVECFNSVDQSCSLTLLLGWYRLVCSNGQIVGKTKAELRDIHNRHMDLGRIPKIIVKSLDSVQKDKRQLAEWENVKVTLTQFEHWIDNLLPKHWGKKASCRVYHICMSGYDVDKFEDPFEPSAPTAKSVIMQPDPVPGSPQRVENLYDVSQALSWVASRRTNPDERIKWQSQIPELIRKLACINA